MLDWEENLFVGLRALYRRVVVRPRERRRQAVRVALKDRRRSLLVLAQMIAGRPLAIFETPDPALCRDDRIFLPAEFSAAGTREANEAFYRARAILAGLAIRDGWKRNGVPVSGMVAHYAEEFPRLGETLDEVGRELLEGVDLWQALGVLPERPSAAAGDAAVDLPPDATGMEADDPPGSITEIEGRGQAEVEQLPSRDEDGTGADLPMHTFEKAETLEEYTGQSRKSDAADELEEHEEALRDVTMTQVMRSPERPRSIYRADLILDGLALEDRGEGVSPGLPYPEWDHRRHAYRPNWCFVRERMAAEPAEDWLGPVILRHRRLIHQLRRQFASLISDWLRLRRQPVGSEFDVDAVVDSETERRTGHTPSEAVYLDRRRDVHDIAALILMDQSYSTDAWLDNHRVLDVIRESVVCVGQVLEGRIERFALAAFASNTRRSCEFTVLKDFQEPWAPAGNRLGGMEPRGYTRIGPALRHAQERLLQERVSRRIIILLTDGRPCDYDRYEGTYGIQDVKKAIEVGRQQGILTHALAIEKQAAEYFPRMFSQHHFDILPRPDGLARTMCRLFARLLAS